MQKIIGLDIGSYSIKAVEIVNTLKSYEVTNFYEKVIPISTPEEREMTVAACMESLFIENELLADRIVTAMPGQFISSRVVPFSFHDPVKIGRAIFSEIEDVVPFNLDDMILDHQILGSSYGKTFALAVLTRKAFLKNFLDLLHRIDIDPKIIDVDSLAFYNLSSYMAVEADECFAMIDIGHEKTSLCIVREGVLRMFRSINLGGKYVTEFLARDLETSFEHAQAEKHRVSQLVTHFDACSDLSDADRYIANRITLASNGIVKELGRTFYAFKTWEKSPINQLFLSGGTSQIRNMNIFLEEQLGVICRAVRLDESDLELPGHLSEFISIIPQSVGIGVRAVSSYRKNSQVNLRQGEFSYVQNYQSAMKLGLKIGRFFALMCVLLVGSYGLKHFLYSGQISDLKEQYRKELIAAAPSLRKKYAKRDFEFANIRKQASRVMRAEINQKKSAIDFIMMRSSGSGALLALKNLSESMPKELKVDFTSYDYKANDQGMGKVQIRGETGDYESHGKIVKIIEGTRSFLDVKDAGTSFKPGSDQKIIQFRVNASFNPNRDVALK
jgi:type IV pilus assembly protein PilM